MTCRCGKTQLEFIVEVAGEEMTLRHCSNCDFHIWTKANQSLELNEVLDLVALGSRQKSFSR